MVEFVKKFSTQEKEIEKERKKNNNFYICVQNAEKKSIISLFR